MNIIAAPDNLGAIGFENHLLYDIKKDKELFRKLTTGKIVVMGRKTLESLPGGKPLADRTNIVFSGSHDFYAKGCIAVNSIDDFNTLCSEKKWKSEDIFIIGGSCIYSLFIPLCDTMYITEIYPDTPKKSDRFFPYIKEKTLVEMSEMYSFENGKYRFLKYKI